MKKIDIAVMGHGVVGSGVVEVLLKNHDMIEQKCKHDIFIKYILDLREFPGLPYSDKFIRDFDVIEKDPDVRVVVEVMGGVHPAYEFVSRLLKAGKSVCTSNKELVAEKGCELLQIAEAHNVNFLFEASVGGGIPVLRPMSQCLCANHIEEVVGILNGTTNFILTKMIREGMSFSAALAMAQKLGYAERDPSADVDGHDACRKICILASLAFGHHVYPEQVYTEGISQITLEDVAYAADYNSVIKLIGRTRAIGGGRIVATVYPALVSRESQLATVDDVFNAILVRGDEVGDVMFYGRGAGKLPTASAVAADVVDCVKHLQARKYLSWEEGQSGYVADHREDTVSLYVYGEADSKAAALSELATVFPDAQILTRAGEGAHELAFITPAEREKELTAALGDLMNLKVKKTLRTLK